MEKIWTFLKKFNKEEEGTELVEWVVMVALIITGVVVTIGLIGTRVLVVFQNLLSAIS
jgi:Flp pilus assembly pilin Flp